MDPLHQDSFDKQPPTVPHVPLGSVSIADPNTFLTSANDTDIEKGASNIEVSQAEEGFDLASSQEATRSKIAWVFTATFLAFVGIALFGPYLLTLFFRGAIADPAITAKELTTTIASILAGPFGFIVGFYFKKGEE